MTAEDRAAHVEREAVVGAIESALTDHLAEALGWEWDGGKENIPTVEDVIAGVVADLMPHVRAALPQTGDAAAVYEEKSESFFAEVPAGIDIARYFWHETDHRNPGCDGINLFREGADYCYLWVEAVVDLDMWEAYLLDIRTHVGVPAGEIGETRDYLFVMVGAGSMFEVEWHNQPIDFAAGVEAHRDRFQVGMRWLASRVEQGIEDYEARAALTAGADQ